MKAHYFYELLALSLLLLNFKNNLLIIYRVLQCFCIFHLFMILRVGSFANAAKLSSSRYNQQKNENKVPEKVGEINKHLITLVNKLYSDGLVTHGTKKIVHTYINKEKE